MNRHIPKKLCWWQIGTYKETVSLAIWDMQTETIMRYHYILIMSQIQNSNNSNNNNSSSSGSNSSNHHTNHTSSGSNSGGGSGGVNNSN